MPAAAVAALERGETIEAIKIVREVRGLGLKEAKDLVDAFRLGRPLDGPASSRAAAARQDGELPAPVIAALQHGSKIEAIVALRRETGVGLKDAKESVERYIEAHPSLRATMAAANAEKGKRFVAWFALLAALAAVVYFLIGR
jgi:ribosomal protein L7/L12